MQVLETGTAVLSPFIPNRRCILTLVTSDDFVYGAELLAHSFRRCGTKAALVAMIIVKCNERETISTCNTHSTPCDPSTGLSESSCNRLRSCGWLLHPVAPLSLPDSLAKQSHVPSWIQVGFTKLRLWQLHDVYDRILYIDSDCMVVRNVDHLLCDFSGNLNGDEISSAHTSTLHAMGVLPKGVTFAAAPDTFPPDRFNAGVMIVQPDAEVFATFLKRMSQEGEDVSHLGYDAGDTGFLNMFFGRSWLRGPLIGLEGGDLELVDKQLRHRHLHAASNQRAREIYPDHSESAAVYDSSQHIREYCAGVCRLSFGYNALRTMQWMTAKQPNYWNAIQPLLVIHYCSSPKPWNQLSSTQRRGGILEKQWFEMYDEMKEE